MKSSLLSLKEGQTIVIFLYYGQNYAEEDFNSKHCLIYFQASSIVRNQHWYFCCYNWISLMCQQEWPDIALLEGMLFKSKLHISFNKNHKWNQDGTNQSVKMIHLQTTKTSYLNKKEIVLWFAFCEWKQPLSPFVFTHLTKSGHRNFVLSHL